MSSELNHVARLEAMAIDDETRAILRELRPKVAACINEAVDEAYARILRFPEVNKVYGSIDLAMAKRAQRQHWLDDVFSGEFSEQQFAHSVEMGRQRQQSGLDLRWYFTFWMVIFAKLVEAIVPQYRREPKRLPRIISALSRTIFYDIEVFTAVYVRAAEGAAAVELNRQADHFEHEVADTAKLVAESVTQLRSIAQSMSVVAERTAEQAKAARAAGEQVDGNSQTAAAATGQLSASIQEISRQVEHSTGIAQTAVEEAQRTNTLVQGLVETSSRIGDIVKLIRNIAAQTNLLASIPDMINNIRKLFSVYANNTHVIPIISRAYPRTTEDRTGQTPPAWWLEQRASPVQSLECQRCICSLVNRENYSGEASQAAVLLGADRSAVVMADAA